MRQFLLTILVLIVFLSPVYNQTLNKSDLKNDIQVIIDSLPKLHPNLFFEISEQEFIDNFNSVKNAVDTLSDFEIVMKLQEATAKIGDQHTKILFGEYLTPHGSYPFEIRLFSDGLFII